ncbi:MAG: alpha/beta hydrolase [Lautropia sp.]
MRLDRYPPQEPLSPLGQAYHRQVLSLGEGVSGIDAQYGQDPYQGLTVFEPPAPNGDVLVFFHGGGWTSGFREWMYFMAPALTAQGVTFVSAGYRLAPQHVFPTGFDDCADAVAWVVRNIPRHGADASRVFVGGHSAGGHYAALLAVSAGWRSRRGLAPDALRGCLPVSGVYRFGADSGMATRPRFLGPPGDGTVEIAASPLAQLQPHACAPFLVTHGSRDFPHLVAQAGEMVGALRAAGVPVQVDILDGCDHFEASLACGDPARGWPARAAAWMQAAGPVSTQQFDPPTGEVR